MRPSKIFKEAKPGSVEELRPTVPARRNIGVYLLVVVYYCFACIGAYKIITHATASSRAMEKVSHHLDFKGAIDLQFNLHSPASLNIFKSLIRRKFELS